MARPAANCVFCSIARGEEAASIIVREGGLCAFLDARPVFKGHVLVIPTEHVADFDGPYDTAPLFALVKRVSLAVREGLGAQGSFIALNNKVSQSVPHLHVHVVPRTKGDGLRGFFWPRLKYASDAERDETATRIARALR